MPPEFVVFPWGRLYLLQGVDPILSTRVTCFAYCIVRCVRTAQYLGPVVLYCRPCPRANTCFGDDNAPVPAFIAVLLFYDSRVTGDMHDGKIKMQYFSFFRKLLCIVGAPLACGTVLATFFRTFFLFFEAKKTKKRAEPFLVSTKIQNRTIFLTFWPSAMCPTNQSNSISRD